MKSFSQIYEKKGVYGSEEKLKTSGDRYLKTIEEVKKIGQIETILDVGCGAGYFTNELAKLFPKAKVSGTDISRQAITKARKKYKKVNFKLGDTEEKLPFPKNYFDLIVCGEIIEHLVDVDQFIKQIYKVLKKDGFLIITTPNLVSWFNRLLVLFGKWPFYMEPSLNTTIPIFSILGKSFPPKNSPPAGHLRLFTSEAVTRILDTHQLVVLRVDGVSYLNKPIVRIIDLLFSYLPNFSSGLLILAKKRV